MEIDSTVIKVQENNGQDSKSIESDFIPSKSTSKLIKNCMRCIGALVLHVENAVSKSNGLILTNNSSKVQSNDGNDIEIVEHSVKHDPEDASASRYLRSIKRCVLQLCLLCVEQNIYVNCDLTFNQIHFYGCLDDSTRSLVINYLTENIVYMIEHIGFIISMFSQEKDPEEAKNIRKSLQKIYKQILLIPLNPNLDETPEVFQNLNNSLWYCESMQHLEEKLSLLRTSLIRFKKVLKKLFLDSNYAAENIDISSTKRKVNYDTNQLSPKRMKHESNGLYSTDNVFRIPDIPSIHKPDVITVESDTERKKKKKHKAESETNENRIVDVVRVESDSENKKNKKHRVKSEINENNVVTIESDTESVKKKKKHRVKSELNENNVVTIESDTESVKKKKKHRVKSEINENNVVTIESDTESMKKKKKHKITSEINENNVATIESDNESVKKKKKHKIKSEIKENNVATIESDNESVKKKKKHKIKSEIKENNVAPIESDNESVKKKKKHKIKSEIKENNVATIESDNESVKKKKKHKIKLDENGSVIIESDAESLKNKKKHKKKSKSNGSEISEDLVEEESEYKRKDKKRKHKEQETNNRKIDRNKTISECSDISIGKLFTSQLEIGDEDLSLSKTSEKSKKTDKRKPTDGTQDFPSNDLRKSKKNKNKRILKEADHNLSDILSAFSKGEVEVLYEDDAENVYKKYVKETDLSENEKFLYLQDLLLVAKESKELTTEIKEKLKNLFIMVNWDIPPIHEVERRLTAGPLPHELKQLEILGLSNNKFSGEEDSRIRKNFAEFCKLHDLEHDASPFLMMRHGKQGFMKLAERRKFVQFLGKGLDNRALSSIYRRFKVLFRNRKSGRFTHEEDELILTYCKKINSQRNRFSELATILHRTRLAIQCRHKTLTRAFNEKIRWNLQLENDVVNGLLKTIGSKDVQDLKKIKLNADHYNQVGTSMQIDPAKIRNQWLNFIYTKLFATEPLNRSKIRTKLIELLIKTGETDARKVNWDKIVSNFEGFSKEFLWNQFMVAQHALPERNEKDLGKTLNQLKNYIECQREKGKKIFSNKTILRYRMTENGLEQYE